MWRAWPTPSAKTVAQKPAGSFRPLSPLGQVWLTDREPALDCPTPLFSARKRETLTPTAASAITVYGNVAFIVLFFNSLSFPTIRRQHHFVAVAIVGPFAHAHTAFLSS